MLSPTKLVDELTSYSDSYCPDVEAPKSSVLRAIASAWSSERSLRMDMGICLGFVIVGLNLNFDLVRWAITVLAIGLLFAVELVNSALERLVDQCVGNKFSSLAKEAKDLAAGAVLSLGIALITMCFFLVISTPTVQSLLH